MHRENVASGVQNARRLLSGLERSLHRTHKYEDRLLQCRRSHLHSHDTGFHSDTTNYKESTPSYTEKSRSSRSQLDLAESWSTMSIVCLQYQYEELSKRYEALLRAYDERCSTLSARNEALLKLRQRIQKAHGDLALVNKALLTVGEKYLSLKFKKIDQKMWYEKRIERLKSAIRSILATAERARLDLDQQIERSLASEHDDAVALLLAEIKRCNLLFLENLRLKSQIEERTSM